MGPNLVPGRTGTTFQFPRTSVRVVMLRDAIKHIEQGTRLPSGDEKWSRACARLFCSILFCSRGTILVSPFWDFFIKVATFLFKAVCLLTVGGGVEWEPLVAATLLKSSSYTRENENWKMW